MEILSENRSALDVHLKGTIGTFRVSAEDGTSSGVEVRYLLTHVTLSEKQGQTQLLDMLAPVREVFDLTQLDFDEIMQRDIDDARVSLELIPYLLDNSTAGLIKLFPPIVAVVLPLKPNSRVPDAFYRKVDRANIEEKGYRIEKITAGQTGEEQFQFKQYFKNDVPLMSDGAELSLSRDNCALAIVDGQHRAMAMLALYRNLKSGWTDSRRSPYEDYYKVWPDKEIRSHNLSELQLPVLICSFPQLDGTLDQDIDVVRAARRVFLTLNKTAKKVSESRNKLLNDQDIVAECLRETLSYIKALDIKDDTALRIWNVELDQEGDRVKVGSDVAFSGVNHLYHVADNILMSNTPARGVEQKSRTGAPRRRLDDAYQRLALKDILTADQREVNTKFNYSDEIAVAFRSKWKELYVPIIDRLLGKIHPFAAFSRATISLNQSLIADRDTALEKMLFDGQATSRTFDEFREGLHRRIKDKEPGWTSPEINETFARVEGVIKDRQSNVESMKAKRANMFLDQLSTAAKKKVISDDGVVAKPLRDAIDRLYENVFSTVAFQTAVVCTYAEAVQQVLKGVEHSTAEILNGYIAAINSLLSPSNIDELKKLLQVFEGKLDIESEVKLTLGGPTFRHVVLPGELQPSEWPKYRYLFIELWTPENEALLTFVEEDRRRCRQMVAQGLYQRRLRLYCDENRVTDADLDKAIKKEILARAREMYEEFLHAVVGRKVSLTNDLFEASTPVPTEYAEDSNNLVLGEE
jgi:hypothetical protein